MYAPVVGLYNCILEGIYIAPDMRRDNVMVCDPKSK